MKKSVVNNKSDVYYADTYWNDIPQVLRYMNKNFTGSDTVSWITDFKRRYAKRQFNKALFINCGNGWVEREFIDRKIVKNAVGFDYSNSLLQKAKRLRKGRKIHYFQADANLVVFNDDEFDLVVNVASLHHVQYLNRFCYQIARSLKENGYLVNFEYVGPRRNQYSRKHWSIAKNINDLLPSDIRQTNLTYPHLPTMLDLDPTEAIHADEIFSYLGRYFTEKERHDTFGAIAYLLLTHNPKVKFLHGIRKKILIDLILTADTNLSEKHKLPTLFSYFIYQPDKYSRNLNNYFFKNFYQLAENFREFFAGCFYGVYSCSELGVMVAHTVAHSRYFPGKIMRFVRAARSKQNLL